jgi:hypothetical protein
MTLTETTQESVKVVTWEDPRKSAREARRMSCVEFFDQPKNGS